MKKPLLIIAIFCSLKSIAQFEYIDQSELYSKYGITTVNAFFHDSDSVENNELWKIDKVGRVIYNELTPVEDDSSLSATIWKYQDHLLIARKNIGVWNVNTNKIDTALTEFFYDESGQLIQERQTDTKGNDTLIKDYNYLNGLQVAAKLYIKNQHWWDVVDTTIYYPAKTPKLKATINYSNEHPEYKKELFYDSLGVLQIEVEYAFDGNVFTLENVKTFIYEHGKLSRIKEVFLGTGFVKKVHAYEKIYEYNDKGLVSKCLRFQDGELINYNSYDYQ